MALRDLDALNEIWRKALNVAGGRRSLLPAASKRLIESHPTARGRTGRDGSGGDRDRQLRVAGIAREAAGR